MAAQTKHRTFESPLVVGDTAATAGYSVPTGSGAWSVGTTRPTAGAQALVHGAAVDGDVLVDTFALPAGGACYQFEQQVRPTAQDEIADAVFAVNAADPTQFYVLSANFLAGNFAGFYRHNTLNGFTAIPFPLATFAPMASTDFAVVKVQWGPGYQQVKVWRKGDAEPSSWAISTTDATYSGGSAGVRTRFSSGANGPVSVDEVYYGDPGATFPGPTTGTVTGSPTSSVGTAETFTVAFDRPWYGTATPAVSGAATGTTSGPVTVPSSAPVSNLTFTVSWSGTGTASVNATFSDSLAAGPAQAVTVGAAVPATTGTVTGSPTSSVGSVETFTVAFDHPYTGTVTPAVTGTATGTPVTGFSVTGVTSATFTVSWTGAGTASVNAAFSPALTAGPAQAVTVGAAPSNFVNADDPNVWLSPGDWFALPAGSGKYWDAIRAAYPHARCTWSPTARVRTVLNATGNVTARFAWYAPAGGGAAWKVVTSIDKAPYSSAVTVNAAPQSVPVLTAGTVGSHPVRIDVTSQAGGDFAGDSTTANPQWLVFLGFAVDSGTTASAYAPTPLAGVSALAGDSYFSDGTGDSRFSMASAMLAAFGHEGFNAGRDGSNWGGNNGSFGFSSAGDALANYAHGIPRVGSGGDQAPDRVVCHFGRNSAVDDTAAITATYNAIRAAYAGHLHFCVHVCDGGGYPITTASAASVRSAYASLAAANPGDTKFHLIDPGAYWADGANFNVDGMAPVAGDEPPSSFSQDGSPHLKSEYMMKAGAWVAGAVLRAEAAAPGGGGRVFNVLGGSLVIQGV